MPSHHITPWAIMHCDYSPIMASSLGKSRLTFLGNYNKTATSTREARPHDAFQFVRCGSARAGSGTSERQTRPKKQKPEFSRFLHAVCAGALGQSVPAAE